MTVLHQERIKMTADQYLQLGEDPPGVRLELVNGEIIVSASSATPHAYTLMQLLVILATHVKGKKLGIVLTDTDHVLTLRDVRRPDIYFFSSDRLHLLDTGPIRQPPDLAVEIISPGSENTDRIDKFEAYRAFGIPCYWIIDPRARSAKAYKLRRRKYVEVGSGSQFDDVEFPPFDGLTIPLNDLWWPFQKRRGS